MTQRQWEQLKDLFAGALEQSPEHLESFVGQVKESEPQLYDELRRLLAEHQSSPDGLRQPALLTPVEASPRFSTGTLVAQRFRIVEFLARGGMGEVYEAEDLRLGEHVALKAIRRDIAGNPRVLAQFKQEVQLARKVTHPNVCRIFDLIHLEDGADLLSMELVRGETLSSYLKQHGPMPPMDALRLVEQIASALEAAHDVGVIHGDLKPGNVILTSGTKGTRAVVMDFGLALRASDADQPQRRDGTPDYMAPEQRDGGPVTTATDIYTFGLVIRSMVQTGVWDEILHRCLQPDPKLRYARPAEIITALRVEGRRPILRRSFGIAAAIGIVGTMLYQPWRANPFPFEQGNWVMLEAFENRTGEPLFDGTLKALIERELSNSQFVSVADHQRVDDALRLMKKSPNTLLDRGLAREVALRDGGIALLITGRVEKDSGTYRLTVDLVDPVTDKTLRTDTESAAGSTLVWQAARRLTNRVRESLGDRKTHIDHTNRQMEKVTTPSLRALQLFTQADDAAKRSDWTKAAEFSRQALAVDPNLASAHIWLAWALKNLKHPEWQYEVQRALELSSTATERERYFIEASNFMMAVEFDRAIPVLTELVRLYPDHYFGYRNLANAYTHQGRTQEASEALVRVTDLRPNDYRSQVDAAWDLALLGDLSRASQYARRGFALASPDTTVTAVDVLAFFVPFYEALASGRSNAAGELETIGATGQILKSTVRWEYFAQWMTECYLAIGKSRAAREWLARIPEGQIRAEMTAYVAFGTGEIEKARLQLSRLVVPQIYQVRLLAVRFRPTDALRLLSQDIAYAERLAGPRPAPAKPKAEDDLSLLRQAMGLLLPQDRALRQIFAEPLAVDWERQGKLPLAIEVLERAGQDGSIASPFFWVRNQVLLAGSYRRASREGEARVMEGRLRSILSAADPDSPLLKLLSH